MRPSPRLTGLLVAFLVLGAALGFMAGAFVGVHHLEQPGGRHFGRNLIVNRLERELDLTADQKVKVQEIMERNLSTLRARRHAARREMVSSREETQREIETVLNPRQREKYRRITARMLARWGRADSVGAGRDH